MLFPLLAQGSDSREVKMITRIEQLITSPEGKQLEFKRDTSALKQIMRTIVAFANTAGGIIIIGRENNGEIVGVEDPLLVEEQLSNAIADSIAPMLMPDIEIVSVQGKPLLCIRVAHWPGPFYLKREGHDHGVYIRLGSTTRQASTEFTAEMSRAGQGISFDRLACPELNVNNLDAEAIQRTFLDTGMEISEQKLLSLGVLVPYGDNIVPSNGGVILFGSKEVREQYFPDARVSCALFQGKNKAHFLDRLDIDGGILSALSEVPKFIRRNSRLASQIDSFVRKDITAYPDAALREVLINAIAHADYSLPGMRILISIFSDRLEIQSPGLLPFGMTLDNFKAGTSMVRNHTIAKVFRQMSLMEEWGSGYHRVSSSCNEYGYPIPEWLEIGPVIRVIFTPHPSTTIDQTQSSAENVPINVPINVPANVPVNKRQQWFLNQLQKGIKCNSADIAAKWDVVEKTAKRDIGDLQKKDLITFVGPPKTGVYQMKTIKKTIRGK